MAEFVFAEDNPSWVDDFSEEKIKDPDFARIRTFFQDHCPVKGSSARGRALESYGWENKNLLRKVLEKDVHFFYAEKLEDMKACLEAGNLIGSFHDCRNETVCFLYSKKDILMQFFSHVRNCFAHNRFAIKPHKDDWLFILEDVSRDKKVSARMILKKSTLLRWIEIIEGGEKSFKEK